MSQRAIITGISGFVGGFLAEHLLDCGDAVLGISPDGRWLESSPAALAGRVEVLPWNIARRAEPDKETYNRIRAFRPNAIYHLAAMSIPADCGQDAPSEAALAVNVEGTSRVIALCEALCGLQADGPRLLFASSSHVYAPVCESRPVVDETSPLGPCGGYGQTKLQAERLVVHAARRGRIKAVAARAFQHSGPRQSSRMMLPSWARQLSLGRGSSENNPLEVHTRDAYIDLTDVRDVVRVYRLLLERGASGEIYNVGSGIMRRSGDLLKRLIDIDHSPGYVVELHSGRKQDPIADISKLQDATGWQPRISIEQTIEQTLQYWRDCVEKQECEKE